MVTALDSKSSGVFPRGFETYWRLHFLRKNNTWWSRGGRPREVDLSLGPSLSLHGIKKAVKGTYVYTDMGQGCELPQTILCAILFAAQLKQKI